MTRTLQGTVHGRMIELKEDLGLAEGQEVEISLRTVAASRPRTGEGLLRSEGALADDPYWDAIMEEIHRERQQDSRKEISE